MEGAATPRDAVVEWCSAIQAMDSMRSLELSGIHLRVSEAHSMLCRDIARRDGADSSAAGVEVDVHVDVIPEAFDPSADVPVMVSRPGSVIDACRIVERDGRWFVDDYRQDGAWKSVSTCMHDGPAVLVNGVSLRVLKRYEHRDHRHVTVVMSNQTPRPIRVVLKGDGIPDATRDLKSHSFDVVQVPLYSDHDRVHVEVGNLYVHVGRLTRRRGVVDARWPGESHTGWCAGPSSLPHVLRRLRGMSAEMIHLLRDNLTTEP